MTFSQRQTVSRKLSLALHVSKDRRFENVSQTQTEQCGLFSQIQQNNRNRWHSRGEFLRPRLSSSLTSPRQGTEDGDVFVFWPENTDGWKEEWKNPSLSTGKKPALHRGGGLQNRLSASHKVPEWNSIYLSCLYRWCVIKLFNLPTLIPFHLNSLLFLIFKFLNDILN